MKNYTITVNGNVYEVTVEEGFTGAKTAARAAAPVQQAAPAPVQQAAPAPVQQVAPAPAPVQQAAPAPAPAQQAAPAPAPAGGRGSVEITAPMPGKILGVKASAGQAVKRGQVVVILEAMKMENEIVAPQDGVIASIDVSTGESVDPGAVLATMN